MNSHTRGGCFWLRSHRQNEQKNHPFGWNRTKFAEAATRVNIINLDAAVALTKR
jgi:hypothetical protein